MPNFAGEKPVKPQPYTKNYRQLKLGGEVALPREEHTNSIQVTLYQLNRLYLRMLYTQKYTYICRLITIGDKTDHKFEGAWGGVYKRA